LVLTHGMGDDATTWDPLVEALGHAVACTAWDLRGHGTRRTETGPYALDDAAAELAAVVAATTRPPERPVLVGHSLGGYLSLLHALHHPATVEALVLIATGPGFRDAEKRQRWNEYVHTVADGIGVPREVAAVAEQHDAFVLDHLADLAVPVVHLVGWRDHRFHAGAQVIESRAPDAYTVLLAGAGHHPHRSHPALVADEIRAFLRTLDATGS
jgi:pimeloyl-ACP methyl ester carboxylesterase